MTRLAHPVTATLEWIAKRSLSVFGVSVSKNAHYTSSLEELRGAIDLHHSTLSAKDARAMLHSILDLNEVDVDEIMVHRQNVMMVDASLPPSEILNIIVKSPYTRIPLWKDNPDNIVGILHVKSVLRALQKHKKDINQLDILSIASPPWFIPEATTLSEQLQAFRERKEHFALVVDEYGAFMGIVTLEDIVEEIVGDIHDELDLKLSGVWVGQEGQVFALGTTTLRDLNRQFGWTLPDEEAATLAGLILYETRTIPKVNQSYRIHGFTVTIARRSRNQITLVRITPPQEA